MIRFRRTWRKLLHLADEHAFTLLCCLAVTFALLGAIGECARRSP